MTQTTATPTNSEPNNLADALVELRSIRADLARADKPTHDLLAELADTRLALTNAQQQRDRLNQIWQRMVEEAAAVEQALIRAGFDRPTFRAAALIDSLAADRDEARANLARLVDGKE